MTDFLTRIAQRAIGMAPAIKPVVASRYAPSRLPLVGLSDAEADTGLNTEKTLASIDVPSKANLAAPINESRQGAVTNGTEDFQTADESPNRLVSQSEPTLGPQPELLLPKQSELNQPTRTESVRPTSFRREAEQPPTLAAFVQAELNADRDVVKGASFNSHRPTRDESHSTLMTVDALNSRVNESPMTAEPSSDHFVSREESIVEVETKKVATTGWTQEELSDQRNDSIPPSDNRKNRRTALPEMDRHSRDQKAAVKGEPGRQDDEFGIPSHESELRFTTDQVQTSSESYTSQPSPAMADDRLDRTSPVVRVTIGRIEVRSVPPSPPTVEPHAAPTPKLSLDDFLRQHNGRRQ